MDEIEPYEPNYLTEESQHNSLVYIMFLKGKRDYSIKDRGFCDGRKQQYYVTK